MDLEEEMDQLVQRGGISGIEDARWQAWDHTQRQAYIDARGRATDRAYESTRAQHPQRQAAAASRTRDRDLATLKSVPERTAEILRTMRAEVAAAQAQAHRDRDIYQPKVIQQRLQAPRTKARDAIAALEAEAQAARERLESDRLEASGKAKSSVDANRALLEQRAWARMQPVLDRCKSWGDRVARVREYLAEASKTGDSATIRALSAELPAYLEAHEDPGFRERRLRAHKSFTEANGEAKMVLGDVHAASLPHRTNEEREAAELAEAVKPAEWAVSGNIGWARRELNDPRETVSMLFGWEQKSTIPVTPAAE